MEKRIGVLLSGRGSNFEALADSVSAGRIPKARIAVVVSNKPDAPGLERAKTRGIPALSIPSKGLAREEYDRKVAAEKAGENAEATWVEPKYVADVEYRDGAAEGYLRHSSFKGLREHR